jgi:hypothetical protein
MERGDQHRGLRRHRRGHLKTSSVRGPADEVVRRPRGPDRPSTRWVAGRESTVGDRRRRRPDSELTPWVPFTSPVRLHQLVGADEDLAVVVAVDDRAPSGDHEASGSQVVSDVVTWVTSRTVGGPHDETRRWADPRIPGEGRSGCCRGDHIGATESSTPGGRRRCRFVRLRHVTDTVAVRSNAVRGKDVRVSVGVAGADDRRSRRGGQSRPDSVFEAVVAGGPPVLGASASVPRVSELHRADRSWSARKICWHASPGRAPTVRGWWPEVSTSPTVSMLALRLWPAAGAGPCDAWSQVVRQPSRQGHGGPRSALQDPLGSEFAAPSAVSPRSEVLSIAHRWVALSPAISVDRYLPGVHWTRSRRSVEADQQLRADLLSRRHGLPGHTLFRTLAGVGVDPVRTSAEGQRLRLACNRPARSCRRASATRFRCSWSDWSEATPV